MILIECYYDALGECDFQNGWCTWYNLPNSLRQDNFDWIRGKGNTPSSLTGPQADHNGDLTGITFMKYLSIDFSLKYHCRVSILSC